MALAINVTKKNVSERFSGLWFITFNLQCLESDIEVINEDVSVIYKTGYDIDNKRQELLTKMQAIIDEWISEQQIFDHQKMDNLVTYLETNLTG